MKFSRTSLPGVWLIELELREDPRGFLARTYCDREFSEQGLNTKWPQCNLTLTHERGTIRGMHFQDAPALEAKLVRCTRGRIFDVVVKPGRQKANGNVEAEKSVKVHRPSRPIPINNSKRLNVMISSLRDYANRFTAPSSG